MGSLTQVTIPNDDNQSGDSPVADLSLARPPGVLRRAARFVSELPGRIGQRWRPTRAAGQTDEQAGGRNAESDPPSHLMCQARADLRHEITAAIDSLQRTRRLHRPRRADNGSEDAPPYGTFSDGAYSALELAIAQLRTLRDAVSLPGDPVVPSHPSPYPFACGCLVGLSIGLIFGSFASLVVYLLSF